MGGPAGGPEEWEIVGPCAGELREAGSIWAWAEDRIGATSIAIAIAAKVMRVLIPMM